MPFVKIYEESLIYLVINHSLKSKIILPHIGHRTRSFLKCTHRLWIRGGWKPVEKGENFFFLHKYYYFKPNEKNIPI